MLHVSEKGKCVYICSNVIINHNIRSCWLTPIGGLTEFKHDTKQQCHFLLYKEQGYLHLWLPVGQKTDTWLSPGHDNTIDFYCNQSKDSEAHLLVTSTASEDFCLLVETALNYYTRVIKKENTDLKYENQTMVQNLGYCTWNAFGKAIDKEKLFESLDSLQSNNIPVKYIIIDDGWQEIKNERISSIDTCKKKFPNGLKETVFQIKSKYPSIESVGVWHVIMETPMYIFCL